MVASQKIVNMLNKLKQRALEDIKKSNDLNSLEKIFRQYLGRKGELTKILRSLKDLPSKQRADNGKLANQIKRELDKTIKDKSKELRSKSSKSGKDWIDMTAPGISLPHGTLHPITLVQRQVENIFQSMGFIITDGPEVETEYYNFDALNVPKDHPARDLWDTF